MLTKRSFSEVLFHAVVFTKRSCSEVLFNAVVFTKRSFVDKEVM